jgi:hypothetical protein
MYERELAEAVKSNDRPSVLNKHLALVPAYLGRER